MDPNPSLSPSASPAPAEALSPDTVLDTLWRCLWDALVLAFLVQIFGSVVIGLVGDIWREMTPSLPPVLAAHPSLEAEPAPAPSTSPGFALHFLQHHRFVILFGLFLVSLLVARFARHLPQARHRHAVAKLSRVFGQVSDQWFHLIVVNAFTAFVGVIVLQFVQAFTLDNWLWHLLGDLIGPLLEPFSRIFTEDGLGRTFVNLSAWYEGNHLKFVFWLLYSAAICDDLGLPNYKALGRFLWRRFSAGKPMPAAVPDMH